MSLDLKTNEASLDLESKFEARFKGLENELRHKDLEIEHLKNLVEELKGHDQKIEKDLEENQRKMKILDNTLYNDALFIAVRKRDSPDNVPWGIICFDYEDVDRSNSFDVEQGVFQVPIDGLYLFQVNGQTDGDFSQILVVVNGWYEREFDDDLASGYNKDRQVTFYFTLNLKTNDFVYLSNSIDNSYFTSQTVPMTFMGMRITN